MYKWFVHSSLNLVGYDDYSMIGSEEDNIDIVEDIAWDLASEWATSFFSVIDENEQDEYEANGESYMETFIFYSDVFCYVEKYDTKKHDRYFS